MLSRNKSCNGTERNNACDILAVTENKEISARGTDDKIEKEKSAAHFFLKKPKSLKFLKHSGLVIRNIDKYFQKVY